MTINDNDRFLPPDIDALTESNDSYIEREPDRTVDRIIALHHDTIISNPRVTMIGQTLDTKGDPAILIGVVSDDDLSSLPSSIDGIGVVVQVTGKIKPQ